ncbi:MAG: S24/S26 family peptidase [Myxococcales bacterium]|nr:S24/S26 family peptidase [Myxococcales bacterium]
MSEAAAAARLALEALAAGLPVRLRARGASMRPAVRDGDVLLLAPDAAHAGVGDLVLVPREDFGVVHRVIARVGERVWVKGDALPRPDGWFDRRALPARVVGIERGDRLVALRPWWAVPASLLTAPLRGRRPTAG